MNRSTLIALSVAAVVALTVAIFVDRADAPRVSTSGDERLVPGLTEALNDVESIRVTTAGENGQFTVTRSADGWIVPERAGFPADLGRVRELARSSR